MRKSLLASLLAAFIALVGAWPAQAQNTICPTAANGTSDNRCASTQFVQNAFAGGSSLALLSARIFVGNASNLAVGVAMSGDASLSNTGAITVTRTNGTAFGPFATSTDAKNNIANFNSGTSAGSSTFWRGDGTWAAPASGLNGTTVVSGATTTYTSGQSGFLVERSNSGAPMIDTLPGTSPGILPANTIVTVKNNDTAGVLAINAGSGASLKAQLAPTGYVYVCPGQSASFYSDGAIYWATTQPGACVLQAATTFYFAGSGTASTNHGLTSSAPLTPNQAYQLAQSAFFANGKTVTFADANATDSFTAPIQFIGPIPGQGKSFAQGAIFPVQLVGNAATPSNVTVTVTGNSFGAIQVIGGADVLINGFKVSTSTGGNGIYTESATSQIENINCGNTTVNCFTWTRNAYGQVVGALTFSGINAGGLLQSNSWISWETTATMTMAGGPVFSSCFACSQYAGSIISDSNPTFSGATGASSVRYSAFLNGVINTGGGGASYYPGTVAGSTTTGGQYN